MSAGEDLFSQPEEPPRFADGKEDGALRTIGEVAKALSIRPHVLRYWEDQFPMLKPLKRSGGRRYYRAADVALVETIDRLVHREGYTLKGAKQALQGGGAKARPAAPAPVPDSAAPARASSPSTSSFANRARLIALRTTLVQALHDSR